MKCVFGALKTVINTKCGNREPWQIITITASTVLLQVWLYNFAFHVEGKDATRWAIFRNRFKKMMGKIPEDAESEETDDDSSESKPKSKFFDIMMLMKDVIAPPHKKSTNEDDTQSDASGCSTGKKRIDKYGDDVLVELEERKIEAILALKSDNPAARGPDYQFFISLLPYFEELDNLEKLQVRSKIQVVLTECYSNHLTKKYSKNHILSQYVPMNYQTVNSVNSINSYNGQESTAASDYMEYLQSDQNSMSDNSVPSYSTLPL